MFLNDLLMFILKCNLCSYANGNIYTPLENTEIKKFLEMDFMITQMLSLEPHDIKPTKMLLFGNQ